MSADMKSRSEEFKYLILSGWFVSAGGFQPVSNFLGDKCLCRKVKQVMIQNLKTVIRRRCGEKVKMLTGSAD